MDKKVMVIAAHIGDFVWRSGGTIAKYVSQGAEVQLLVLTYGMRGEMNGYWKQPDASVSGAKALRHAEGEAAAKVLGISKLTILDYEDYPMRLDRERVETIAMHIRAYAPDLILTHDTACDPYNADHTLVGEKIYEAISVAAASGVELNGLAPVKRPRVFGFEPHVSEVSNFHPDIFVDFTDVHEIKEAAMRCYKSQASMLAMYTNRARIRAQQSKRGTFAEAFSVRNAIFDQEFLV